MSMITLRSYFVDQLKDLYSAEQQLLKAIPKMEEAATEESLKEAFHSHYEETREHVERLAQALVKMDEKVEAVHCEAMAGIIKEGESVIKSRANDLVRDVALIAAAQRVEHYEIAGYGSIIAIAKKIAPPEVIYALELTLHEESAADSKLTKIAEGGWFTRGVNDEAGSYDKDYREASGEGGSKSSLEDWTKSELQERASELEINGRSTMNKEELVGAIRDAN